TCFDYGLIFDNVRIIFGTPDGRTTYFEKFTKAEALDKFNITTSYSHVYVEGTGTQYFEVNGPTYKLRDKLGNYSNFLYGGLILYSENAQGDYLEYTNNGSRITSIMSSDGYEIVITYTQNKIYRISFIEEKRAY